MGASFSAGRRTTGKTGVKVFSGQEMRLMHPASRAGSAARFGGRIRETVFFRDVSCALAPRPRSAPAIFSLLKATGARQNRKWVRASGDPRIFDNLIDSGWAA